MRIFVIVVCNLAILTYCGQTTVRSESDSVQTAQAVDRLEDLNRLYGVTRSSDEEERNKVNHDVYVTPVMSRYAKLRSRNPLLSWLANVLNFGGGQSEASSDVVQPVECPKCSKYENCLKLWEIFTLHS